MAPPSNRDPKVDKQHDIANTDTTRTAAAPIARLHERLAWGPAFAAERTVPLGKVHDGILRPRFCRHAGYPGSYIEDLQLRSKPVSSNQRSVRPKIRHIPTYTAHIHNVGSEEGAPACADDNRGLYHQPPMT